jgi:predicted MFS family arabinose efflux permease
MRTLFYIFAICLAALILFVTVDRVERDRPLAILLMILILGIVAAAVLIKVMP